MKLNLPATIWLALALPLLMLATEQRRDEWVIVVNKANKYDALSREKLKLVYMKKISRWPWGAEVTPIHLTADSRLRRQFTEAMLGMTEEAAEIYWIDQKVTRNVSSPSAVAGAAAAKTLVASRPGAIAYIPRSAVDDSVKILNID